MKKLLLILLLAVTQIISSQNFFEGNEIIEPDKLEHFVFGGAAALPGYYLGWEMSKGKRSTAIWTGLAFGTGVNVVKELTDGNKNNAFSTNDVVFGVAGAIVTTFVTDLIFQSEGSKKRREDRRLEKEKKHLDELYDNEEVITLNQ
ncbi:MAG: hypothetical protein CMC76_11955 [Flavobacteriaceae bacterium]|nr:hypothetical protein [Flavobacteriaceae bacterium]|tara:strand:- start:3293 stop:3730 length:438 start_codon:yes stop_codon:yes gene_type:complete